MADGALVFPSDAAVVIAGIPGAGKTTLIRRAVDRGAVVVVDAEDRRDAMRARGERPRRTLYVDHYVQVARAAGGPQPVVIHTRGTLGLLRRATVRYLRARGRPTHLVLLDAERPEAEAGQRSRGRMLPRTAMDRQVARWERVVADARSGALARREGWDGVTLLDRAQAAAVPELRFEPQPR